MIHTSICISFHVYEDELNYITMEPWKTDSGLFCGFPGFQAMKIDFGLFCVHDSMHIHCIPLHIAYESIGHVLAIGLDYGNMHYLCVKVSFCANIHVYMEYVKQNSFTPTPGVVGAWHRKSAGYPSNSPIYKKTLL